MTKALGDFQCKITLPNYIALRTMLGAASRLDVQWVFNLKTLYSNFRRILTLVRVVANSVCV